jgi:hypothetical protein
MGCGKVEESHLYRRVYIDDWARWKASKSAGPAGTESAFEDRYLAPTFSSGRISICLWAATTHCYHTPLIFTRKRSLEERTLN